MTKVQLGRLERLGNHVLSGDIAHKKFDFSVFNDNPDGYYPEKGKCGTNGCAFGELPELWPRLFKWHYDNIIRVNSSYVFRHHDIARDFFGLTISGYEHLFVPESQYYGKQLNSTARRETVGKHILKFVQDVRSGKQKALGLLHVGLREEYTVSVDGRNNND